MISDVLENFLAFAKFVPMVTLFFLFLSLVYHVDANRIVLAGTLIIDSLGWI